MKCCAICIGDRHLRREIIPAHATETGTCSYCGSSKQALVEPAILRDVFELVIGIYTPDSAGKTLGEWFQQDWAMFVHARMDAAHVKELLGDILDDGEVVRKRFAPSADCHSDASERWQSFRRELMHENRFFPRTDLDLRRLEDLLPHLLLDDTELPTRWYRARIHDGDAPLPVAEMGAPPQSKATHGRANPAGIPYLYLASTSATAVSELRPHTGEAASVAEFSVPAGLKILDLASPRETVSPFMLADESKVALLRGDIGFLEMLGEELTRPVLPQAAAVDYTPSQYLCEFVKNCGFDGVRYRSSVGDGVNVALFEPARGTATTVRMHRVTRVAVDTEEMR